MDPEQINITVHGLPKSGKSTIAQVILRALLDAGFDGVTLDDLGPPSRVPVPVRVQAMQGTKINIETHQWFNTKEDSND